MKKKIFRFIGIALTVGFAAGLLSWWLGQQLMTYKPLEDGSLTEKDPILTAFQGSGAKFEKLNFIGWAQINTQYLSEKKLISLAKEIAANFGSINGFTLEAEDNKTWRQIKLDSKAQVEKSYREDIHILIQSRNGPESIKARTYYSINITSNSLEKYQFLKDQFEKSLKNVNESNKGLTTIITGWYSGTITAKGMKNIANKTLALSEAKIVEGIGEKNFLSISAYTPQIKNKIRINDREINFNVALRVNAVDRKTYFYLGSPIIAREY